MSQTIARLNITTKNIDTWKKLVEELDFDDIDYGEYFDVFKEDLIKLSEGRFKNNYQFTIDEQWYCDYFALSRLVDDITDICGEDVIVIADFTDINVDTFTECIYYINKVVTKSFDEDSDNCAMALEKDINNIKKWFEYGKFKLSKNDKLKYDEYIMFLENNVK